MVSDPLGGWSFILSGKDFKEEQDSAGFFF